MTCTSPCTISGLYPGTEYQFTVIPNNNCGSPTGCTGNRATAQTACECDMHVPTYVCTMAEPARESERKACTIPTNPPAMGLNDTWTWSAVLL